MSKVKDVSKGASKGNSTPETVDTQFNDLFGPTIETRPTGTTDDGGSRSLTDGSFTSSSNKKTKNVSVPFYFLNPFLVNHLSETHFTL